jgi:hypothetical protein
MPKEEKEKLTTNKPVKSKIKQNYVYKPKQK